MKKLDSPASSALLSLLVASMTQSVWAQAYRAVNDGTAPITEPMHSPVEQAILGIVGNGIHGIVGNGLLQQINEDFLVLNDRVYLTGPRTINVAIDFQAGTLQDVGPGHVLQVNGQFSKLENDFAAKKVTLDSLIRGQVQSVTTGIPVPGITVMNQFIPLQNYSTVYEGPIESDLESLQAGDFIRISGWLDQGGNPIVTRVDILDGPTASLEISGPITAVDAQNAQFQINSLTIDYSTAALLFLDSSDLTTGNQLEVAGTLLIDGDTLQATTIRPADLNLNQDDKSIFDIEGIISEPTAASEVRVSGIPVTFNEMTLFDRGSVDDLNQGEVIQIEGRIFANGLLVAESIRFVEEQLESEIRIFSRIESIDHDQQALSALGLTISYSAATRFDDHSGSAMTNASIEHLSVGDFVQVRGYDQPDGGFMVAATRIRKEEPDEAVLRARVSVVGNDSIVLLGKQVVTNVATEFEDISGVTISATEFFELVQPGSLIDADVVPSGNELVASKLSFEE